MTLGRVKPRAVRARTPATSANLGPGFDSFGLALAKYDVVEAVVEERPSDGGGSVVVEVAGEGAADVPRDASHLVARSLLAGLATWAEPGPRSLHLRCTNELPHGRGLGSSAAAIVAGLTMARAVLADPALVADSELLTLASRLEGHPDNVAACLFGGFVVAWTDDDGAGSVRLTPDPRIQPVACVPGWPMSTEEARGLLPAQVPHGDAVFTAARAGLLVAAISQRPDLLLEATADRLHQPYRAAASAPSAELLAALRAAGIPAVMSGAGPSVLALTVDGQDRVRRLAGSDWQVEALAVDTQGATVEYLDLDTRSGL